MFRVQWLQRNRTWVASPAILGLVVLATASYAADRAAASAESGLNLNAAVVVTPANASQPEKKAAEMLVDEVEKRTYLRWKIVNQWPADASAVIVVATRAALASSCAAPRDPSHGQRSRQRTGRIRAPSCLRAAAPHHRRGRR